MLYNMMSVHTHVSLHKRIILPNAMLHATDPQLVRKYITPLTEADWDKGLLQFYRAQATEALPGEQLIDQVGGCVKITLHVS